jgi:hypothetical protein
MKLGRPQAPQSIRSPRSAHPAAHSRSSAFAVGPWACRSSARRSRSSALLVRPVGGELGEFLIDSSGLAESVQFPEDFLEREVVKVADCGEDAGPAEWADVGPVQLGHAGPSLAKIREQAGSAAPRAH